MLSNPVYDPFQILTKIYSDGAHVKQAISETYIEELYRARTVRIVYGVLLHSSLCAEGPETCRADDFENCSVYASVYGENPIYGDGLRGGALQKIGKIGGVGICKRFSASFFPGRGRKIYSFGRGRRSDPFVLSAVCL